jgi:hypothetical protein
VLELSREMKDRQSGNRRDLGEFDALAQMRFDIFAHAMHHRRRQAAADLRLRN